MTDTTTATNEPCQAVGAPVERPVRPHHIPTRAEVAALMKRCQIGVGGRNALDNAHSIMAECYGTLGRQQIEIERLRHELARCGKDNCMGRRCDDVTNWVTEHAAEARVAAERERCAKLCEQADKNTHPADLADAIRRA